MRKTKFMALALAASVASGLLGAKASAAPTNGMAAVFAVFGGRHRIEKEAGSDTHHIRACDEGLGRNWSDRGVSSLHPSSAPPEVLVPNLHSYGEKGKAAGFDIGWRLCCLWLYGNARELFRDLQAAQIDPGWCWTKDTRA